MTSRVVDVHGIWLDVSPDVQDECSRVLTADELARSERFVNESLRCRWSMARAGLRKVLGEYCGTAAENLRFATGPNGKPFFADTRSDVHFNLSHSANLALVAVTGAGALGVDLEYQRPIPDWRRVARRFFSSRENEQLASLEECDRVGAFYRCWTRKEALIKATGEGLSARLDDFDVTLMPHDSAKVLHDRRGDNVRPGNWFLHHLDPDDKFVAAVAIRSTDNVTVKYHGLWSSDHG